MGAAKEEAKEAKGVLGKAASLAASALGMSGFMKVHWASRGGGGWACHSYARAVCSRSEAHAFCLPRNQCSLGRSHLHPLATAPAHAGSRWR